MESGTVSISSEPDASRSDADVVRMGVNRFNMNATGMAFVRDIALFVRDPAGTIEGGLLGYVWAEWLHITELWVSEAYRGRGFGGRLLAMAEQEAAACGARGALLNTFDFQAPEFYRARGYEALATLGGYPPGHTDYHMRKRFPEAALGHDREPTPRT